MVNNNLLDSINKMAEKATQDSKPAQSKTGYQPFKLDNKKYPDAKTTPYGFIYNVGNSSITDLAEQERAFKGDKFDPNKKYGFSRTTDSGDEVIHDTFEQAYNASRNGGSEIKSDADIIEENNNKTLQLKTNNPNINSDSNQELVEKFIKGDISEKEFNKAYRKLDKANRKDVRDKKLQRRLDEIPDLDEDYERSWGPGHDEDIKSLTDDVHSKYSRTPRDEIEKIVREEWKQGRDWDEIKDAVETRLVSDPNVTGSNNQNKPLHIRSLENQVSKNTDYKKMAELVENIKGDESETRDAYFYAFKDAYEKSGYKPTALDIERELRNRYRDIADSYREGRGYSDTQWDRYGYDNFLDDYGEEEVFVDEGLTAWGTYLNGGNDTSTQVNVPFQNGIKGRVVSRNGDVSTIEYKTNGGITRREAFYNSDIEKANRTNNPTQNNYDRFNQAWSKFVNSQGSDQDHEQFLKETTEIFGSPAEAFKALAERFKGQYK